MNNFDEMRELLRQAVESGDRLTGWHAAGQIVSALSDASIPVDQTTAFRLVWTAVRRRWFDMAELLAGAAAARSDGTADARRLHAQMLLERGFYDEALARLEILRNDPTLSRWGLGELFGNLGRIYKDRFLQRIDVIDDSAAREFLQKALDAYSGWYRLHPTSLWHGINTVALLARPEATAIEQNAPAEAKRMARAILAEVSRQDPQFIGEHSAATMAEASVALEDYPAALGWLHKHINGPRANGFALANLLRQFVRLWQLDRRGEQGAALVAVLRAAVLEREDGVVQMSGNDVRRELKGTAGGQYQAVFGSDRFDSLDNYRRGLERCASVARIGRSPETGLGTGFVIPGRLLCDALPETFVLVTNAHVVSVNDAERAAGAVHPEEAAVTFAALDDVAPDKTHGLRKILFASPRDQLDVAIAELIQPVQPKIELPIAPVLPIRTSRSQVRAIGHPSGRGLSFSINTLLDHEAPKIHYRTATEAGSSGSPVFNAEWKLIGLHHAGGEAMTKLNGESGTYEANEGIWIKAICEAIAEKFR
jgi:hypothetical protein